jgi:hypothetical protein
MEKDLAVHASASLITLLSSIQATSKTKTSRGGYWQNRNTMYAYRDEKNPIQVTELRGTTGREKHEHSHRQKRRHKQQP